MVRKYSPFSLLETLVECRVALLTEIRGCFNKDKVSVLVVSLLKCRLAFFLIEITFFAETNQS